MPNEQNLIPNNQRTPNEVRENARKGGIESGKTRAKKRDLRLALEMLLEKEWKGTSFQRGSRCQSQAAETLTTTFAALRRA